MVFNEIAGLAGKAIGIAQIGIAESPLYTFAPERAQQSVRLRHGGELAKILADAYTPKPGEDTRSDEKVLALLHRASR